MQFTIQDAAELLGMPERDLIRWVRRGHLRAYRVHNHYLVNRLDLLEWATARHIPLAESLLPCSLGDELSLRNAMLRGGISRVAADNKHELFRAIVDNLQQPLDGDILTQALISRDQSASGLNYDGLVLPLAAQPLVLPIAHCLLHICLPLDPLTWNEDGTEKADAVFILLAPTVAAYLGLTSRLDSALQNTDFVSAIKGHKPDEVILELAKQLDIDSPACVPLPIYEGLHH